MAKIRCIAIAVVLASLLSGCRTQTAIVERVERDSIYITKLQRDSVFIRDSVSRYEETHGDTTTIYVDRWRTHYKYIARVDTQQVLRVDSIPYPVEVEVIKYKRPKIRTILAAALVGFFLSFVLRFIHRF